MNDEKVEAPKFDFTQHEQAAVAAYLKVAPFYVELSEAIKRIVEESLRKREIRINAVEARGKSPVSFGRKAAKPSESDPAKPMYPDPLNQIQDLAAVRVITFFPRTLDDIDKMLKEEFKVIEHADKGDELIEEEKFGYKSIHYLVKISSVRASLPEYQKYKDAVTEIQVRTILQHAWAEIEHDIQYKSSITIPKDIRRRFMALAGLLEIADREFQAIQDADDELEKEASASVARGQLTVEITPRALKQYLDKQLGADGRVSEFTYDWLTRLAKRLGFRTLEQVDECIKRYGDGDRVSRAAFGARQGQSTRFEMMLFAGMGGERFMERHMFAHNKWFVDAAIKDLDKMKAAGIPIGDYDPLPKEIVPGPA